MKVPRKKIADALFRAAIGYYTKKNFGVNTELGVMPWGKRRVDIIAVNRKGHIVICEIKSCKQDFVSDKKYLDYLLYCNQMYIVIFHKDLKWMKKYVSFLKQNKIGIHILFKSGIIVNYLRSSHHNMKRKIKKEILLRLAWRNAEFSKRNTKRVKVFIEGDGS